ncbi:MAG TPA: YfiR family protein [Thermoanaerobaculia bacterium]
MRRRMVALAVAAGLLCAQARGNQAPEYQVKAAFIYKFATYIRWPATTGADAATPFVIGIIGKDPFGPALSDVVQGERVQGRVILIRRLGRLEEALHCDVLFVSQSERRGLPQIFAALRGAPVLTVGDMDQFAELGGMINLITTEDHQIRFDINKGAIDRAGLKAASQLLRLARIVDESRSGGG